MSSPVLRGGEGGNTQTLPDNNNIQFCTLAFPKGTPETLITEALDSFPLFHRLLENNRPVLELDIIDHLLDLKEKLGNKVFSKLLKSRYPLAAKEISHKLGMAELKRNLDPTGLLNRTTLDLLLQIGTEGCAALAKGSEELAVTLINQISDVAGGVAIFFIHWLAIRHLEYQKHQVQLL